MLDDHGGHADVFHLVEYVGQDFGRVLAVTKAAELLELVDTPKQDVVLTPEGTRFLAASIPERKHIFRDQAKTLRIFHDVLALLARSERHEVDVDVVLSSLALHVPYEDPDRMLTTLVNWGRHADLFDYDLERGKLVGDPPQTTAPAAAAQ